MLTVQARIKRDESKLYISSLFENKLKTRNEIDQEILNVCELTTINNEIQESEEIVARIMDCQRRIKEMKQKQQSPQLR